MSDYADTYGDTYGLAGGGGGGGGLGGIRVGVESRPDGAALYVTNDDGSERKIGDTPDLPLRDYTIATQLGELGSAGGGFTTLDVDALLPEHETTVDFGKFSGVSMKLHDRTSIWDGRLDSTPETSPDRTLTLAGVGHAALLTDNPVIRFLGCDNDMTAWEDPPGAYIDSESAADRSVNTKFALSVGENALSLRLNSAVDGNATHSSAGGAAWYLPPMGTLIDEVQYVGSEVAGTNMDPEIRGSTSREDATGVDSSNLTLDLAVHSKTFSTAVKSVFIHDSSTTDVNKVARVIRMYALTVFGDHGLQRRDVANGIPQGLYFSDILRYLIELYVPDLHTVEDGVSTITDSTYAMASAVWRDTTDMRAIIEDGIRYEPGMAWAVWEGPTMHYRPRHAFGRTWVARRGQGAQMVKTGPTSEPDFDRVVVEYTDGDGATKTVGYPGSNANTEDASLLDLDSGNPAKRVGGRVLLVDVQHASKDHATAIGQVALAEAIKSRFAGEVELPRYASCEGTMLPTNMLRAGDRVIDGDSLNDDEMPIVSTTYQRSDERPMTAVIDTPANRLDAAIAKLEGRPRRVNRPYIRKQLRRQHRRIHNRRRRAQLQEARQAKHKRQEARG